MQCSVCKDTIGYQLDNGMGWVEFSVGHAHGQAPISRLHGVPEIYIDSMIFEVKKGRSCEKTLTGLTRENAWLDSLRQTQDQEIALYQDVIANQNEILAGFPRELKANAQTCEAEKKALKRQIRRARRAAIVTGAGLAFCLVLLL